MEHTVTRRDAFQWILPCPLSNDSSDRLNHKWVLLLMLLLALVTFIVPLHPDYNKHSQHNYHNQHNNHNTNPSSSNFIVQSEPIEERVPTYTAVCWTPQEFTSEQVLYASSYCSRQYNAAIHGRNDSKVYRLLKGNMGLDPEAQIKPIQPFVQNRREQIKRIRTLNEDFKDEEAKVAKLVTYQIPITLLLVAVGLGLSHAIWGVLVELFGSFNIEATISAVNGERILTDVSNRNQTFEDMAQTLKEITRKSPNTLSVLYVIKKGLSLLIVLALALFLILCSLPEVAKHRDDAIGKWNRARNAIQKTKDAEYRPGNMVVSASIATSTTMDDSSSDSSSNLV